MTWRDSMENRNWKREKLRSTQPFFVLNSESFIQESYRKSGISHFYMIEKKKGVPLRMIPNGSIDFIFSYEPDGMKSYVNGTPLSPVDDLFTDSTDLFGVRFMPGTHPTGLAIRQKDLIGLRFSLEDYYPKSFDFQGLSEKKDFLDRVRFFIKEYSRLKKDEPEPFGMESLFETVCDMIYETDGQIRISDLAEKTGYSDRYIRKVFQEEMGFSPKIFCNILRLQRAIEFINYGFDEKTADWAASLGYYDQAQCIRDFRKYLGMTPRQYKKLISSDNYQERAVYAHDLGLKI
jgi:AraC-like DNA-binding protein